MVIVLIPLLKPLLKASGGVLPLQSGELTVRIYEFYDFHHKIMMLFKTRTAKT